MMNFGLWIKKRSNMSRIKIVIIIAVIAFFCLQLDAQDNKISKSTGVFESGQSSITIVDVDISSDVPVYEYVPKVIIRGKWGKKPGEFGREGEADVMDLKPESMAVDSKGNIYILDFVNNRIQKFDSEGRYLKSIEVDGLRGPIYAWEFPYYNERMKEEIRRVKDGPEKPKGIPDDELIPYIWPPEVQGINIVIDSNDTLYYYLVRYEYDKEGNKTKEIGEVWEFKDDKLVRKMKQGEEKISERYVRLKKEEDKIHKKYNISLSLGNKILKMSIKHPEGLKENEKFVIYSYAPYNGEYIFISHSVYTGKYVEVKKGDWTQETILEKTYMVNKEGKIVGIINEIVNLAERMDKAGNCYGFESENDGITVRKYELKRVK
jgi:hypothetical protein